MIYRIKVVYAKQDKNNHIRRTYTVYAETEQLAIEKVNRAVRRVLILKGNRFILEKTINTRV